MVKYYRWRVRDPHSPWTKLGKWRELSWEMTEEDAAKWCEAHPGSSIERVPNSETTRTDVAGGYKYPASGTRKK